MEKVVLGIVDSPLEAEATVERLCAMGFESSEISVLYDDRHGSHDFGFEHHTKAPEGALTGAALGGVIGAGIGLSVGLGLLAFPALGALVAAGPVLAALSGAAAVAMVLGVVGALVGLSVPEIQAKHYAGKAKHGSILVAAHANGAEEVIRAREVLRSVAAKDVIATGEAAIPVHARA